MSEISSFRAVIDLWPSREGMAADLKTIDPDANASSVSKWHQRNNIPSEWWFAVLATDRARVAGLNAEMFTTFAAREPVEARA